MVQHVTFIGNAAANPELRWASSGVATCRLPLICQDRRRGASGEWEDGAPHTVFVTVFRDTAERVADSVSKGDRIVVVGTFSSRKVESEDGTSRWFTDFVADEVALSTKFAEVRSKRVLGSKSASAVTATPVAAGASSSAVGEPADPWAVDAPA